MGKFWRQVWNAVYQAFTGFPPDAKFSDLPWQGWDDAREVAVETQDHSCADAVFSLTQRGYYITGVNRSARLLHINTPGRIALNIAEPYDSRAARRGSLQTNMRNCTHGQAETRRH